MSIKDMFLKVRDDYVIDQVRRVKLPGFRSFQIKRYRLVFSGRVLHV